jgi:hypothetical protein
LVHCHQPLQGHCRVVDLPELQQLLALLEVYGPVLEPEGVDELLVQVRGQSGTPSQCNLGAKLGHCFCMYLCCTLCARRANAALLDLLTVCGPLLEPEGLDELLVQVQP